MVECVPNELYELLASKGQAHLLEYFAEIPAERKASYIEELKSLDYDMINDLFEKLQTSSDEPVEESKEIQPYLNAKTLSGLTAEERKIYKNRGLELISQGKVGLLMCAGGQASRLESPYPKGMFDISLISHKSLFQIFAERLIRLHHIAKKKYPQSPPISWVITTNRKEENNMNRFFADNNYFGLDPQSILIYPQDMLPAIDMNTGKILMKGKAEIGLSPNGTGGIFDSMTRTGALQWIEEKNIEYLHFCGVDNVLLKVCDPIFIGFAASENLEFATKVVIKTNPKEKVGVLVIKEGKMVIEEYSELGDQRSEEKDNENNMLLYRYGNILSHIIKVDYVKRILNECLGDIRRNYYKAVKKVPYFEDGAMKQPQAENGLKFELFYYEIMKFTDNSSALVVEREQEFAPVKNKSGPDSPATARKLLANEHCRWLRKRGVRVPEEERTECYCEISPLVSYDGEALKDLENQEISFPYYLSY